YGMGSSLYIDRLNNGEDLLNGFVSNDDRSNEMLMYDGNGQID
ncbi:unnamed protein product, partial [Rotaria sordida]